MATAPDARDRREDEQQVQSRWLPYRRPRDAAPAVRLMCFHCAAGSASFFVPWERYLARDIELCAVQLPGRERRYRESPYTRMEPLVADLAGVLGPLCDRPCIFFGHSMGARVAYALARHLAARRDVPLLHLVVSGSSAPHRPSDRELHTLSDDELLEELQRMNGTPPEILQEAEVRQHLLPLLRADLTVSGTYASSVQDGGFDTPDLPEIPIVALGGRDDHIVSESGLRAWADLTRGPFRLRMFPGGHFFLNDRTREIAHELLTLQSREARHVARR